MAHVFGHNCSLQFEERNYRVISVGTSRGVEPYRRVHTLDRFGRTAMSGKGASGAHLPLLFHWRYYSFTCRQFAFLFTIAHIFMIITHLVNHEGLERITNYTDSFHCSGAEGGKAVGRIYKIGT